jgi:hypothetical protein
MSKRAQAAGAPDPEVVGLMGLVFIAGDEARLQRFLQLTGIEPQQLRTAASETGTLAAVLDHLMADQSLLLVLAADTGLTPQQVADAHSKLSGNHDHGDLN